MGEWRLPSTTSHRTVSNYLASRVLLVAAALAATGCRNGVGTGEGPPRQLWHYSFDGCNIHPPASDGSRVFAGFQDGFVRALDLATGSVVWQTSVGGSLFMDFRL